MAALENNDVCVATPCSGLANNTFVQHLVGQTFELTETNKFLQDIIVAAADLNNCGDGSVTMMDQSFTCGVRISINIAKSKNNIEQQQSWPIPTSDR